MKKHSSATRKKISDGLKRFYASGGKRGQKAAQRLSKSKQNNTKSLLRNQVHAQKIALSRKILMLRKQALGAKPTSAKAKALRNQIRTLYGYRKALMKRLQSIK